VWSAQESPAPTLLGIAAAAGTIAALIAGPHR
jgi:hypothetical protein